MDVNSFYKKKGGAVGPSGDAGTKNLKSLDLEQKTRQNEEDNIIGSQFRGKNYCQIQFSILEPNREVKNFPRQSEAIESSRQSQEEEKVFSMEIGLGGARTFLTAHPDKFWSFYRDLPKKHYYEVLVSGRPCKLYFDLEFSVEANPEKNGEAMVQLLIEHLLKDIKNQFMDIDDEVEPSSPHQDDTQGLEDLDLDSALILDSSTSIKFSHHVIFPKLGFNNNEEMGAYLKDFYFGRLSSSDRAQFTVKEKKSKVVNCETGDERPEAVSTETSFVDFGVYSKNRNFRLLYSSKFGKNTPLTIAQHDKYHLRWKGSLSSAEVMRKAFAASLITHIPGDLLALSYSRRTGQRFDTNSSQNSTAINPTFEGSEGENRVHSSSQRPGTLSPFPDIDKLVANIIPQPGFVRKWTFFKDSGLLLYDIGGSRCCGNIGRQHRSNNVMYVCDLNRRVVCQKCYDDDCRNYRGPDIQLPEEMKELIHFMLDDDQDFLDSLDLG